MKIWSYNPFNMRNLIMFVFCLIVGLTAFGCGGGGGSSQPASTGSSPFVGSYAGTFVTNQGQSGAIALVVSSTGGVVATEINTSVDETIALAGTIAGNGAAALSDSIGTIRGNLAFNEANQLTGPLSNGQGVTLTITVSSTMNGTAAQFAGGFTGTYIDPSNQSGTISLVISASGAVTGLITSTLNGSQSAAIGTITNAGFMLLNVNNGSGVVTGSVLFNSSGQLTGTLNDQGVSIAIVLNKN